MINPPASVEADEIVAGLGVSSGLGSNDTDSTGTHPIVMLVMGLDIVTEFNFAVHVEVKAAVENYFGGALCG